MLNFNFFMPTNIHFGQDKLKETGKIAKLYGKKALIVTGKKSARKFGFLQTLENSLKEEKIEPFFFEKVEPNPSIKTVENGASLFKEKKCDVIIALGGGSALDAGKAIGVLATNQGPIQNFFGKNKVKNPIPPLIAIPTTSGTGSEVTPYAVITDVKENNHQKKILSDPHIFPKEALVDPNLTFSLSAEVTSDTGIDALSHAIESYVSRRSFPLSESIALQAIEIIGKYLPKLINSPKDAEARSQLMYASMLAGIAIAQTGATLLHAMGYRLTSDLGLPHGRANGILFPYFWEANFSGNPEKFSRIIGYLDESAREFQKKNASESALLLKEFLYRVELPRDLNIKINEETIVQFAKEVMENKKKMADNPKTLSMDEVVDIYKKALQC